jgi:hypothetical protein
VAPDVTVGDYRHNQVSTEKLLGVAHLFWPELIEVDGAVFLAARYNKANADHLKHKLGFDTQQLERWINGRVGYYTDAPG